ncbi:MAG: thiamine pyrophosphate-dependent enzyme [Candidatus Izemoplasmatales bacterium]|mgnify:CR=1 FL=1|jgi:2-oxoglutarate ferredoxin oxidoreductase subunit beta|nr:thiamine pyrophosphate-dependent enzyme [Candidatus Izemoplasmatales bacterium]MDD4987470.1 thiamine pyrophosphate-dependent enzyme [Candidatus Izemoplasmatales bacterium]MDY0373384.1 thiamine pyrophosphate-dependent enzyme [Candidatus Izemoplasmatales bacterium]NLF48766.1 MFS transporter [Acholeplasmataceae bacterium]
MEIKYQKTKGLTETPLSYCPGCTHGIIHKLVAESLEELGLLDEAIGVASVGCSVFSYQFFNCDMIQAPHGRACAEATGLKRVLPQNTVFTYQGDGDLASIGIAETIHAANRGENITVIFINNAIYGMTGGQMAPTTLPGQKTTTSPEGRNTLIQGYPIKISEIFSQIEGVAYLERVSATDPKQVLRAKKAIKKAFSYQKEKRGFTLIEVLSSCPVNWGMTPINALKWIKDTMTQIYPLGVFKDKGEDHV